MIRTIPLVLLMSVIGVGCPKGNPCGDLVRDPATESCVCPDGFTPRPELGICEGPDGSVIRYDAGMPADAGEDAPEPMDAGDSGIDASVDAGEDGGVDSGTEDACIERTFFRDADDDGFGDPGTTEVACVAPEGFVEDGTDCDDTCETCFVGGTEVCDERDNDCDGVADDGVRSTFYRDMDGDTFGDPTMAVQACTAPAGYVANDDDCNDGCAVCRPGGTEVCEGSLDENCSMGVDEGCACTNGSMRACPGGTEVGACVAGTQTCTAGAWGACVGAVGPTAESCDGVDNDCDTVIDGPSAAMSCPSAPRVTSRGCSAGACTVTGCSTGWGSCDGAYANGCETDTTASRVHCGGCDVSCATTEACFDSSCDEVPRHLWSAGHGGTSSEEPVDVVIDAAGNVIVVAFFNGTANFGGSDLVSAGSTDIAISKYGPDGAHLWSQRRGGTGDDYPRGVDVDASGNIYVAGYFTGTTNLGDGALASAGGQDGFLASYGSTGSPRWTRRYGASGTDRLEAVVVSGTSVWFGGSFTGSVAFGGAALNSAGLQDIVIGELSSTGTHRSSARYGGTSIDNLSVLERVEGGVVASGEFTNSITLGTSLTSAGCQDVWLARFSSATTVAWSTRFGNSSCNSVYSLAVADSRVALWRSGGNLELADEATGAFASSTMWAGNAITSRVTGTDQGLLLLRSTTTGVTASLLNGATPTVVWEREFVTGGDLVNAFTASNQFAIVNIFATTTNHGGTTLLTRGGRDVGLSLHRVW